MSEYLEEGFEDWLKDLPIDFINHLYSIWLLNNDDTLASIDGADLTYIGPLETFSIQSAIQFIRQPPKQKKVRGISNADIKRLDSILKDNGIEENA